MATPIKYPVAQEGDGVLLRLREDYEQAVLDLFDADQEAKEIRPALEVVGHTSNFLDNKRLPVHRWFRNSAGFSAEWVKWLPGSESEHKWIQSVMAVVAKFLPLR